MTEAEKLIFEIRETYINNQMRQWKGHEQKVLIELVRGLDEAAFAFTLAPNRRVLYFNDNARRFIVYGGATALRPLLEAVRDTSGGIPWSPTSPQMSSLADDYLINCGRFLFLQRLAAMERYGLAQTQFDGNKRLIIRLKEEDREESETRKLIAWNGTEEGQELQQIEKRLISHKDEIIARIDKYARVDSGWFLSYDPDLESIEYYRDSAILYAARIAETDALPKNADIGGREFREWTSTSVTALGKILHHIACATRLKATHDTLKLRNLLTLFARKEDIKAVWMEGGESKEWTKRIINAHLLTSEVASIYEKNYDLPIPYYIECGRDFFLLPVFGGLLNAHAGLVSHLQREYRTDWDRAVNSREEVFRSDLQKAFAPPRYDVPDKGFRLKRSDGSHITDIDAIALDKQSGQIILIQLKWPDIYSRSLAQRNSRRLNLLKANDWVDRVHEWVACRSSHTIATELGIKGGGSASPAIYVISRHIAKFSGETAYNPLATWLSWPSLMNSQTSNDDSRPSLANSQNQETKRPNSLAGLQTNYYELPGLTVEVCIPEAE